ncbi:ATP-binding cassette domain-containing protein [Mycolicibacillus parakoreensis]|uniref:ATP-binding cassette domain-containing protein n=1 Tax=Mycolicibacillus parakoreensis TaxID=1069221 RepID=A0ABY3UBE1_9MYCO|nr:ATP-binding cassette domain-containing protein [Mycolicibacillus parakoreensis]ULN54760.2 ATP-binding cassette domain-containing protein [Mycolicibacillus parakoreensis]
MIPLESTAALEFTGIAFAARGISVRGPTGCAFANVSLDIAAGQLGVIVAPAGSGRTALLLALAARMRLVTGTIAVGGHRLPGGERRVQRAVSVAQAAPAVDLDDDLRVGELIAERAMISRSRPTPPAIAEVFDVLGLRLPRRSTIGQLPRGERTMLATGLAAAERPCAVVVDDADSGCGPAERRRVWSGLHALTRLGCTVVASSTHIPDMLDETDMATTALPHPFERDATPVAPEEKR